MTDDAPVARRQVKITNALGLHLRPAERFVKLAERFQSEIRVFHEGKSTDGKSILGLATLVALPGSSLDLEARGPDADAALAALAELILAEFYEDANGHPLDAPCPRPSAPEAAP